MIKASEPLILFFAPHPRRLLPVIRYLMTAAIIR
jgi:hypothetical protein